MESKKHVPICPKCGYDQSGEIGTWEDQCPIMGQCPECGFEFEWANVMDPSRIELDWYIEHGKGIKQMIRRTIPTLWNLLFPNRYWNRLGMVATRSLKRYLVWVSMMMLVSHLLISAGYVLSVFLSRVVYVDPTGRMSFQPISQLYEDLPGVEYWYLFILESILTPFVSWNFWTNAISLEMGLFPVACLGISLMWFVLFGLFPTTRKRAKLRMVHLWRAVVVGGFLPFVIFELGRAIELCASIGYFVLPLDSVVPILEQMGLWISLGSLLWIQWFWISAVRVGWKVKANWFEMILVACASFFGFIIAAGILAVLRAARDLIVLFA